jgi:myo-inositol 2-dehydrogenase/D-chiro-inositol 1-dehydrogenase
VLLGDVEHLYAVASHAPRTAFPDADVDDVTTASLRFATGAVGSLSATSLLHAKHRAGLELFCEGRRLELDETVLVVDDGAGPKIEATDHGEAKQRVDRAFIDAVQGHGDDVRAPYAVALSSHRLSCAIARSARERVPLDVIAAP